MFCNTWSCLSAYINHLYSCFSAQPSAFSFPKMTNVETRGGKEGKNGTCAFTVWDRMRWEGNKALVSPQRNARGASDCWKVSYYLWAYAPLLRRSHVLTAKPSVLWSSLSALVSPADMIAHTWTGRHSIPRPKDTSIRTSFFLFVCWQPAHESECSEITLTVAINTQSSIVSYWNEGYYSIDADWLIGFGRWGHFTKALLEFVFLLRIYLKQTSFLKCSVESHVIASLPSSRKQNCHAMHVLLAPDNNTGCPLSNGIKLLLAESRRSRTPVKIREDIIVSEDVCNSEERSGILTGRGSDLLVKMFVSLTRSSAVIHFQSVT